MRLSLLLVVPMLALLYSACSDDSSLKSVNEACASGAECAEAICHRGLCGTTSPKPLGDPCVGDAECQSWTCTVGCTAGTQPPGAECLLAEECAASADCGDPVCDEGTCSCPLRPNDAAEPQPDGGAHSTDGPVGCAPGETDCGGSCVDTMYDNQHCGKCNNPCLEPDFCTEGLCLGTP